MGTQASRRSPPSGPRGSRRVQASALARIDVLRVKNYRVLRDLELKLTPMTVLLGPNGSGKSTIFDVFAFLSECFGLGLRKAWDKRGRFRELRSRGADGSIEIRYREQRPDLQPITYHLAIGETQDGPVVEAEWLSWRRVGKSEAGAPYRFLNFKLGQGEVIPGEAPEKGHTRRRERLDRPDMLAVSTLGQLARHPRVAALRRFIAGWYLSYLWQTTREAFRRLDHRSACPRRGTTCPTLFNT